jgi:mono/diheme cytochrome c family protein
MTTKTAGRFLILRAIIGTAVIVGASLTVALAQVRDRDPGWAAPSAAAARVNPLLSRSDATTGGDKLFQQRCATCHGEDGRGTARAPNLNGREVQAQTDGELFWKISTGNTRPGMPAFSFLPEPQRWQLVLSLRRRALRQD